ncbi:hypothetical protein [Mucilaginibacter gotjawali]|nr:hypothetical protein [Mucilaginibacter gotjawali]
MAWLTWLKHRYKNAADVLRQTLPDDKAADALLWRIAAHKDKRLVYFIMITAKPVSIYGYRFF